MARWREIKNNNIKSKTSNIKLNSKFQKALCTSPLHRVKAFITDMFMIMMPIVYLTTYVLMDGADSFKGSQDARWLTMLLYGFIIVVFWVKKGQTPGFKAYSLKLIDDNTGKTLGYGLAIARYMMFIFSAVSIIGILLPFFRKDNKTLQDLVMQTSVINVEEII